MTDKFIWIVTDTAEAIVSDGGREGGLGKNPFDDVYRDNRSGDRRWQPLSADKLQQGLTEFLEVVGEVFSKAKESAGDLAGMELDEIELSVEVNGEGQLSLMGNGGKLGGKGAMTLKFKAVKVN